MDASDKKMRRLDDGAMELNFNYDPHVLAKANAKHTEVLGTAKYENETMQNLVKAFSYLRAGGMPTLKPLLPLLLSLKGKPYKLERHAPFEPMFRTRVPKKALWIAGRQLSKCGYFRSDVLRLANGKQVSVAKLSVGDEIMSFMDGKFVPCCVTNKWDTGFKEVLQIKTDLGAELLVTKEHRLLTLNGYRTAQQLKIGSKLIGVRRGGAFGKEDVHCDRLNHIVEFDDTLPAWVFDMSEVSTENLLRFLWKKYGRVYVRKQITLISCAVSSRCMARGIRSLLNKFGMPVVIKKRKNVWHIRVITNAGRFIFLKRIGSNGTHYTEDDLPKYETAKDYIFDKIVSIKAVGTKKTADIEVNRSCNFVLDGVVSHNSTSMAAHALLQCNSIPHFSTLFLTPLYEMIRRFSQNYVRRFIEESPMKRLFVGKGTINSVLQRTFHNYSQMLFSFAYLDAERVRGISADCNTIDEIQDMHWDFLDVIHETLSGSEDWGLIRYAGTPKSLDNTIERLWMQTSQAEWIIRCMRGGCGHWNIPSLEYDLVAMIGPARDDVSPKNPGTVCAKCRKPIDPSRGRWYHFNKEQRWDFAGYHVPQIIMPMHYANPLKWATLVSKKENLAPNVFFNEVCGVSYDSGSKLVTLTELKAACSLPWKNNAAEAKRKAKGYKYRIVAVDWGGNGGMVKVGKQKIQRISFTVVVALGVTSSGRVDVIWGHRVLQALDFDYEVGLIASAMATFKASHVCYDYGGAGAEREYMLRNAGFPADRMLPIRYHGAASKNPMVLMPATEEHPRNWYSLDKSWSLGLTCHAIRKNIVRFFEFDFKSSEQPGLVSDFLALQEENVERKGLTDVHYITRNPTMSDDFAQATNIGACALWYMSDSWPNLAEASHFKLSPELMRRISPTTPMWADLPA